MPNNIMNGDKLTADNDRVSTGFDGFDDCPTKGDEFEHLLAKKITWRKTTTIIFDGLHRITPKHTNKK